MRSVIFYPNETLIDFILAHCSFPVGAGAKKVGHKKVESIKTEGARGTLTDDVPTGVWQYFDPAGKLEWSMDYDSSRIVFMRPDTARYRLRVGSEWRAVRTNRAPRFLGSNAVLLQCISTSLRHPDQALRDQKQGTVIIGFIVGPQGLATDFAVEQSIELELDKQTLQAVEAAPNHWLPAIYQGQPAFSHLRILVHYAIATRGEGSAAVAQRMSIIPHQAGDLQMLIMAPTSSRQH
ncbi:TonB family C-terminal domain-containing protein [Hymenobacter daecheongensis DSM 21074]|uniref:TonB family C-terminal domain-containing protein n=1 Tax=Hymenobacter daecheongensis DSM 21074 TaxID=1121955 RepID=A0A1M6C613_9BACT|nr:TonB family C-terminal domain-containing protein [Hymenobacter daecheongensis DSM 21074]